MKRRVVLTADDLGRDPATDEVIAGLAREGVVTATTAIVLGPGAASAIAAVRAAGLEPRLHVTLTSERGVPPWRPLTAAPSLAGPGGALSTDPVVLGASGEEAEVVAEAEAQLARLRELGGAPTAADSHAGTVYGLHGRSWLLAMLEWCGRHRLAFRLPRDPALYYGGPLPPELARAHAAAVERADALGVRLPETIATNRRPAADLGSPDALLDAYRRLLAAFPEGTSELFLHPSREDAIPGDDGVLRAWEAQMLRDDRWRSALEAEDVELVAGW